MPHKFLPPLFRGEQTIVFTVPRGVSGGQVVVEFGPEGFKDITPLTPAQRFLDRKERQIRQFRLRDLDPTGDLFTRGAHANVDIVIDETIEGVTGFAELLRTIGRAFRNS